MSLSVEIFNSDKGKWMELEELKPGDRPRSMPTKSLDGKREIITYQCVNTSSSVVKKSEPVVNSEIWSKYTKVSGRVDVLGSLSKGQSLVLDVMSELDSKPTKFRFTHKPTLIA